MNQPPSALRTRNRLSDYLRFGLLPRRAHAHLIALRSSLRTPGTGNECLRLAESLCAAARICPSEPRRLQIERRIASLVAACDLSALKWKEFFPGNDQRRVPKSIILKSPQGPDEKGVLLVSFEEQWSRILQHADLERLAAHYHLVLAPSWSPPHNLAYYLALRLWPAPFFTLVSNLDDLPIFRRLSEKCIPIPLMASSWVHPGLFSPGDNHAEKRFDVVMLANFARYKRHFVLFEALSKIRRPLRVLLLGKSMEGRTAETIRREARCYGVADRVTIREGLPDGQMLEALRSSKVAVITSGTEGSCVAVVELLFAGVPVGLMADARIGSKAFINEQTGVLFTRKHLHTELDRFVDQHDRFTPRYWAEENELSCFASTRVLNAFLKDHAIHRGQAWTRDLAPQYWRPDPTYVEENDRQRMADCIANFPSSYGVAVYHD